VTVTVTVNGAEGAGSAVTVNVAAPPSVTPDPAVTLISGSGSGGGGGGVFWSAPRQVSRRSSSAYTFCHSGLGPSPCQLASCLSVRALMSAVV